MVKALYTGALMDKVEYWTEDDGCITLGFNINGHMYWYAMRESYDDNWLVDDGPVIKQYKKAQVRPRPRGQHTTPWIAACYEV
jgi:hypothetical protein